MSMVVVEGGMQAPVSLDSRVIQGRIMPRSVGNLQRTEKLGKYPRGPRNSANFRAACRVFFLRRLNRIAGGPRNLARMLWGRGI